MPDFRISVWDSHRIYLIDFDRATVPSSIPAAERRHPHRSCPDIDRVGYSDDAHGSEHGPIISARLGQGNVRVTLVRTEISTSARLYALSDNRAVARVVYPAEGLMPGARKATIIISPQAAGRTSISIRYHWPDGPVIGRLYIVVRATRTVDVRAHMVTLDGIGQADSFLGAKAAMGETAAAFHTRRLAEFIRDANHVLEPHGILLSLSETVNTAWTSALFPAVGLPSECCMRAMALSPNRHASRVNLFLVNFDALPFDINYSAMGCAVAHAIARHCWYPDTPAGHVGSGIIVDTTATRFTGPALAHEFGHVFRLSRMITSGANAGSWLQDHATGDQPGLGGILPGVPSRDDIITRRRLMYPFMRLAKSNNAWRNDVGYGNTMGSFLSERALTQDITFDEAQRVYDFVGTAANIYAL